MKLLKFASIILTVGAQETVSYDCTSCDKPTKFELPKGWNATLNDYKAQVKING